MFKKFVHIGVPTDKKMPGEEYCEDMKLWISDPEKDEFKFEYLRFEKDSWMAKEIQTQPHIAVEVDNINEILATCDKVLLEPTVLNENCTIAFILRDGVVLELMEMK
ncbi:hypothetical protein H3N56_01625 [Cetobacterium sp. 2A]|uniref:hypothetical protein n=1 Tax=unclassified Cetobacterium TaxID=2630983 RepID=UPI00163C5977|nr:hypothetical protein [Cetobacterium sp. 2A]MBC2855195.1 hypothetical protein [Cetobacterium sp. 2A]